MLTVVLNHFYQIRFFCTPFPPFPLCVVVAPFPPSPPLSLFWLRSYAVHVYTTFMKVYIKGLDSEYWYQSPRANWPVSESQSCDFCHWSCFYRSCSYTSLWGKIFKIFFGQGWQSRSQSLFCCVRLQQEVGYQVEKMNLFVFVEILSNWIRMFFWNHGRIEKVYTKCVLFCHGWTWNP